MDSVAQKIIKAYAESTDGDISNVCADEGFSKPQCDVLVDLLHMSRGEPITGDKLGQLKKAGFQDEFINDIAGEDGLLAIRKRVHWLAKNSVRHWLWGSPFIDARRGDMLDKLSRMGPTVREVIDDIYDSLDDRSCFVRTQAAQTIVEVGDEDAVPFLIDSIKEPISDDEENSAWCYGLFTTPVTVALSKFGRNSLPILIENLNDDKPLTRRVVAEALGNIGDRRAIGALIKRLNDADFYVRLQTAVALGKMGEIDALPVLMQIVRYEYYSIPDTSESIAAGMNGLGLAGALSLVGVMMENSEDWRNCQNAAWVFHYMDPSVAFWALPDLEDIAEKHPNASCRVQARQAADWILEKTP